MAISASTFVFVCRGRRPALCSLRQRHVTQFRFSSSAPSWRRSRDWGVSLRHRQPRSPARTTLTAGSGNLFRPGVPPVLEPVCRRHRSRLESFVCVVCEGRSCRCAAPFENRGYPSIDGGQSTGTRFPVAMTADAGDWRPSKFCSVDRSSSRCTSSPPARSDDAAASPLSDSVALNCAGSVTGSGTRQTRKPWNL